MQQPAALVMFNMEYEKYLGDGYSERGDLAVLLQRSDGIFGTF